ncbi:2-keto-4-pentenoate hydratase [Roseovarius gaetbuli]|uniref:2-keto-4-pentenoate hydratase n=1 Tax=Roseovarius gaetbuli TaxID=1356575 RepID=A0A1X6YIC8_9RHOB|nr:2-keto-4-pentenoate hydratase [Roseovarius gaetbuli]SLN20510.1 2-keto-4-pentenoate hydratase [Roseovarius gaetbuli]
MNDPLIQLLQAARDGGARLPENAGEGLTRARVFAVQEALAATLGPVGGFKVACPPDAPIIIAPIYASDIHASPASLELPADEEVGVELEYAFRLIAPLPDRDVPDFAAQLRTCVELLPVFELVRSRLDDPKGASGLLKMLDNQLNGAVVFGAPIRDWQDIDVTQATAHLTIGEAVHLSGAAQVPGGDAFATLCKLALAIGTHCGGLQPGQLVITGSLNGLPWVKPGLFAKGEIAGLGAVEMTLEAGSE